MKKQTILSLDPSFAATGYAVLSALSSSLKLISCGWIQTAKDRSVPVTLDDMDRAQQIASRIQALIGGCSIDCIYSEIPLGTVSAVSAKGLSIAKGVVAALIEVNNLKCEYINPFRVKKAVCGNNNATKEEIIAVVEKEFPQLVDLANRLNRNGKFTPKHEAICDAIAVTLAIRSQQ